MFCDQCGSQLQTGQLHCGRCGKAVLGPLRGRNRVQEHVRLLGMLWIAYSALHVLGGVLLLIVTHVLLSGTIHFQGGPPPEFIQLLRPIVSIIAWSVLIKAAAGFLAGFGLLRTEPWARMLALVVGFINLLHVPLGTALGIYTLWVLLPSHSNEEYQSLSVVTA